MQKTSRTPELCQNHLPVKLCRNMVSNAAPLDLAAANRRDMVPALLCFVLILSHGSLHCSTTRLQPIVIACGLTIPLFMSTSPPFSMCFILFPTCVCPCFGLNAKFKFSLLGGIWHNAMQKVGSGPIYDFLHSKMSHCSHLYCARMNTRHKYN